MKFSIIMPVYNNEAYLEAALESVLKQTWTDWEAVCINDGSTDQSGEILDRYADLDARIKVRHQANGGVSNARNAALNIASGDWVCFLDGDDLVGENWLKNVALAIERSPALDWVRTGYCTFDRCTAGIPIGAKTYLVPSGCYVGDGAVLRGYDLVGGQGLMALNFWRRGCVRGLTFCNGITVREDALFTLQIVPRINCLQTISSCDYYYRQTVDSSSRGVRKVWEGCAFQKKLNELWQIHSSVNGSGVAFTWLSIKSFQYWMRHSYCAEGFQIHELRRQMRRALSSAGIRLRLLSIPTAMRVCSFILTGYSFVKKESVNA